MIQTDSRVRRHKRQCRFSRTQAVQTSNAGTQVAFQDADAFLDQCCDSNDCVIYNYSNGDNVIGCHP